MFAPAVPVSLTVCARAAGRVLVLMCDVSLLLMVDHRSCDPVPAPTAHSTLAPHELT